MDLEGTTATNNIFGDSNGADEGFGFSIDNAPPPIKSPDAVFDLAFHPTAPYIAIGQISGSVCIHEFKRTETKYLGTFNVHGAGITGIEFTESGTHLVTVSSDKSINILDCATQQTVINVSGTSKSNPHKHGISSVNICSDVLVSTGDDDGRIVIWDMRSQKPAFKYHEHADYISQMLFFSEVNQLISASGDTCLGVFDLRANGVVDYSEPRKDELSCIAFVPETQDIIAGTANGMLPVWRYNGWRRPYDVYDQHPRDCDCIQTYNDNVVLTGAYDGLIRVLQIHPVKRNLCQLGGNDGLVHKSRDGISKLRISHDRTLVAYCGASERTSFVDIEFLSDDAQLDKLRTKAEQKHMNTMREATEEMNAQQILDKRAEGGEDSSEWSTDSDDDSDDSDDSDGDAEGGGGGGSKKGPSARPKKAKSSAVAEGESGSSDDDDDDKSEASSEEGLGWSKSKRERARLRVDASKWLKEEKKKDINFKYERRRRRVQGFWGDL